MGQRYRIRVLGKPRENPDPAMLAQIVILIGRRLHTKNLQQSAHLTGEADPPEDRPRIQEIPTAESDADAGPGDGG